MINYRKLLSCFLIFLILAPPTQGWGQEGASGSGSSQGGSATMGPGPAAPDALGPGPAAPGTPSDLSNQAEIYLQKIGPQPSAAPQKIDTQMPKSLEQLKAPAGVTPSPAPPTAQPGAPEDMPTAMELRAKAHGIHLSYFGYKLFSQPPSSFLPVTAVPVGPDYIIGPGDSIRIMIWGSVQGEYSLTVDRNGQIAIPKVGVVQVSSLTFAQLKQVLDREFSRQYTNFQMNVTLDNLRTIRIYVVGQARNPGSYAISSLSTLINGLFAAGGPSISGSLRDIQVRRQGRIIVHFDLYDFLIKGIKTRDIRLMPEDVIFIPLASKRVGIGGPVKTPAIYELKGERTLNDLIKLAGDLQPSAFKSRVQLLRIRDRREMVLMEDDLEKFLTGRLPDIVLMDGDLIKLFSVPSVDIKMVRVQGAVQNPGEFGYRPNMRIKDLITFAGGFLMQANMEEAELTRVQVTPQGPDTSRIYLNLRRAMAGNPRENILLKPNDFLFVRTVPEWDLYKLVAIGGEVKFPGNYTIKKGETLSSVLTRAGGLTDKAYANGAFFTRQSVKKMQAEHLKQIIDRLEAELYTVTAAKAESSLDKEDAERQKLVALQQQKFIAKMRSIVPLGRVVIRIDDPERLRGTPDDLELQEGDSLLVPQVQQSVNVMGSVMSPTAVIYNPHRTVKDYLTQVGGPTKSADTGSIYIIKANGSALSRRERILFSGINYVRLDPGDTIVVPEDLERVAWLKQVKDITAILAQIAVTAGIVLVGLK